MPLKVPNYGEWDGELRNQRGYHPPACTCYRCNEAKMLGRETRRSGQADSAPAPPQQTAPSRPAAPIPAGTRRGLGVGHPGHPGIAGAKSGAMGGAVVK